MKVLFDVIYSTQPDKCSSTGKFRKIALRLLADRPDTFIYWPIPPWANEQARAWLPQDDRILYIEYASSKDRVREYGVFYKELEDLVSFFGSRWDYDVLITMRTAQVPNMRVAMNSPRAKRTPWMKKVILLEEMAILDFRKTVPVSAPAVQDAQTILGYLSADVSYITALHVREGILRTARGIYTPSHCIELSKRLRLANPAVLDELCNKDPKFRFKRGEQPFCLGFVGRMSNSMTRLPEIYDVMDKHWIMKGDQGFKVIISTVSTGIKLPPPDFVTVENNPRDKFWARVKQDMHLVISMSVDAEFSLSLIEPIIFGTPAVLAREDWTEGLVGPDYPFFVKGTQQAYAMVRAFHDDYEAMYAKFMEWRESYFIQRFAPKGVYGRNLFDDLFNEVSTFPGEMRARYAETYPNKAENTLATLIMERVKDLNEFVLFDILNQLDAEGMLRDVANKTDPELSDKINLTFLTPWHELKAIFTTFFGWEDGSTRAGHFKRKAS